MGRWILTTCVLLTLTAGAAAEPSLNVDVSVGWEDSYRPFLWTPVEVGVLSNLKQAVKATVTVSAVQDSLNKLVVSYPLVLNPGQRSLVPLVTKFSFSAQYCDVTITDKRGRRLYDHSYDLWQIGQQRSIPTVRRDQRFIGLAGKRAAGLRESMPGDTNTANAKLCVRQKVLSSLPWDWTGYSSLDLLILYDPDWKQINRHQAQAICQYVRNGGKLLMVLGANPLPADCPLAELLPVDIAPARQVDLAGPGRRPSWSDRAPAEGIVCWPLGTPRSAYWQCQTLDLGEKVYAQGPAGFGLVGLLAFDPAPLIGKPERVQAFWQQRIQDLLGKDSQDGSRSGPGGPYDYLYELGPAGEATNNVLTHLYDTPALRPLSAGWVIGVLLALAVLLGPVDYLVLKRLDRLPLTWITSTACIALVTLGAYFGVQYIRAGSMQMRVVSVADGIQGQSACWATTFAGIFAPASDDYRLGGLNDQQWWSGVAPSRGGSVYRHEGGFGSRNIFCAQRDGGNRPVSLPINIWSMQCLVSEAPVKSLPLEATVDFRDGQAVVTVENRSDAAISSGLLLLANQSIPIQAVPAHGTQQFSAPAHRPKPAAPSQAGPARIDPRLAGAGMAVESAYGAEGCADRTAGIAEYLRRGAAVLCVRYDKAPAPFFVEGERCGVDHVQLVRLVIPIAQEASHD